SDIAILPPKDRLCPLLSNGSNLDQLGVQTALVGLREGFVHLFKQNAIPGKRPTLYPPGVSAFPAVGPDTVNLPVILRVFLVDVWMILNAPLVILGNQLFPDVIVYGHPSLCVVPVIRHLSPSKCHESKTLPNRLQLATKTHYRSALRPRRPLSRRLLCTGRPLGLPECVLKAPNNAVSHRNSRLRRVGKPRRVQGVQVRNGVQHGILKAPVGVFKFGAFL